jgi:hypothetical protein
LPVSTEGAQRASRHRSVRLTVTLAIAVVFAGVGLAANPAPADAAGKKVVIVVGPVGSSTAKYIASAKLLAAQARSYGAAVTELYSPGATWSRVKSAAKGANVLIYLGHGNGHPSPYGAFNNKTRDGMGLNPSVGNTSHKYYGEYYIDRELSLAPNAVVILNRLCYASGNSEGGRPNPTKSVAMQRVDNYGAGFLRANAKAVFAEGINSASFILYGLFKTNRTMRQIFWSDPAADGRYDFTFKSSRTPGKWALMDPLGASRYYRSVIGDLGMRASTWRTGAVTGAVTTTREPVAS